jgi:hypothetical protein
MYDSTLRSDADHQAMIPRDARTPGRFLRTDISAIRVYTRKKEATMTLGFPTHTLAAIVVAMIGTSAGAWFNLAAGLRRLAMAPRVEQRWRWGIAAILSTWLLIVLAVAWVGAPYIATFLTLGLLAGTLPLLISPVFRQLVRAIPATGLIGIHAIRVLGILFLALMDMRLLPAEFALPAGYGDIAVGLLALGMVYLFTKHKSYAPTLAIGWNALGLLDFISALASGIAFIGPFAAQLAAEGTSPLYLNYVLIVPAFGVPLYTLLHVYSLFQLLSARAGKPTPGLDAAGRAPAFTPEPRAVHPLG